MLIKKLALSACAAALFLSVNSRPASAQGPVDERTEFTFNAPVELPGVTLPPGTYVFRFADGQISPRRVMQVLDKADMKKTFGMFLTIAAERPKPTDKAELRFMETPAGSPAAIKTWWYPGRVLGREFIYSRTQAQRLAAATHTNVLTTKAENVAQAELNTAELTRVTPTGEEAAINENASASQTVSAPATTNEASNAPVQESTSAANTTGRSRLPRTSTELPLIALMGLASLAGGTSLRFRR